MLSGNLDQIIRETPLIHLKSLSKQTGCQILGKAEFMNPNGSVKDRTALGIILEAEMSSRLKPGMRIYEGTAGNTGIGLAALANSRGYKCTIVMPNNQSTEKYQTLTALGADLITLPPVPFSNENHFYHTAKKLAENDPQGFWADQFENLSNYQIHLKTTGPEIWEQTQHKITDFVAATGTGGTLAGVSCFLKSQNPNIQVTLADPMGSGLYHWFHHQEIKSTGSSITEGIGIMRLTENFKQAKIDNALQINDQEMIEMLYHLAHFDGLLVGTSSALNVVAAKKIAQEHQGSGRVIVTLLCDSATRYVSKVFNPDWLKEKGLNPPSFS